MPDGVDGWYYGQKVWVVRSDPHVSDAYRNKPTRDPFPVVGAVGEVRAINTTNGRVDSVGVIFPDRSWVFPVDAVSNFEPVTDDDIREAITSIQGGER